MGGATLPHLALVDRLRLLPSRQREELFAQLGQRAGALSDIHFDWPGFWARPEQLFEPELLERYGLILITGARREGKTRSANGLFVREVEEGRATLPRIFAATEADVDAAVLHGVSGIFTHLSREQRSRWHWVADEGPAGTIRVHNKLGADVNIRCFTTAAPEGAVSHAGDLDLYDDLAKWGPRAPIAWAHARLSCSQGYACGIVATTRRGTHLLKKLLEGTLDGVLIRRLGLGSNAGNLAAKWRANARAELAEVAGSLVNEDLDDEDVSAVSPFEGLDFDKGPLRVRVRREELEEVVVAVDPADGKGGDHDEWGIGAAGKRRDGHGVALEDASGSYDDGEAGEKILSLCDRQGATKIIVETNRGPRVLSAIRAAHYARELAALRADPNARPRAMPEIIPVNAKDGKKIRAGELRKLYLDGLLHHAPGLGMLDTRGGEPRSLEKQQREWDPDGPKRPRLDDRIDWWTHAVHYLFKLGDAKDTLSPVEAFKGFDEAQRALPAPGWGTSREGRQAEPQADEDDGEDGWNRA